MRGTIVLRESNAQGFIRETLSTIQRYARNEETFL